MVKNLRKIFEKLKNTTTPESLKSIKTSLTSFLPEISNKSNKKLQKSTINFLRLNLIDFCRLIFQKYPQDFSIYEFLSKFSLILLKNGNKTIGKELLETGFRNLVIKKEENFDYFLILGIICINLGFCFLKDLKFKKAFFFSQFFNKNIRDFLGVCDRKLFYRNKDLVYVFVVSFVILGFSIFMNSKGKGGQIFCKIIDRCEKIFRDNFEEDNSYYEKIKYYIGYYKKKVDRFIRQKNEKKNCEVNFLGKKKSKSSKKVRNMDMVKTLFFIHKKNFQNLKNKENTKELEFEKLKMKLNLEKEKEIEKLKKKINLKKNKEIEKLQNNEDNLIEIINDIKKNEQNNFLSLLNYNENLINDNNENLIREIENYNLEDDKEIKNIIEELFDLKLKKFQLKQTQDILLGKIKEESEEEEKINDCDFEKNSGLENDLNFEKNLQLENDCNLKNKEIENNFEIRKNSDSENCFDSDLKNDSDDSKKKFDLKKQNNLKKNFEIGNTFDFKNNCDLASNFKYKNSEEKNIFDSRNNSESESKSNINSSKNSEIESNKNSQKNSETESNFDFKKNCSKIISETPKIPSKSSSQKKKKKSKKKKPEKVPKTPKPCIKDKNSKKDSISPLGNSIFFQKQKINTQIKTHISPTLKYFSKFILKKTKHIVDKLFAKCLKNLYDRENKEIKLIIPICHKNSIAYFGFEIKETEKNNFFFEFSHGKKKTKKFLKKQITTNQFYILLRSLNLDFEINCLFPFSGFNTFEEFFLYILITHFESYNKIVKNDKENLKFNLRKKYVFPIIDITEKIKNITKIFDINKSIISKNILKLEFIEKDKKEKIQIISFLVLLNQDFLNKKKSDLIFLQEEKKGFDEINKNYHQQFFNAEYLINICKNSTNFMFRNYFSLFNLIKDKFNILLLEKEENEKIYSFFYLNKNFSFVSIVILIKNQTKELKILGNNTKFFILTFEDIFEIFKIRFENLEIMDRPFFLEKLAFIIGLKNDNFGNNYNFLTQEIFSNKKVFFLNDGYKIPFITNLVHNEKNLIFFVINVTINSSIPKDFIIYKYCSDFQNFQNILIKMEFNATKTFIIKKLFINICGIVYPNNIIVFEDKKSVFISLDKIIKIKNF